MTTFINKEDLIKNTQISTNTDVELLIPHIVLAEEMYVTPVMGQALTQDLLTKLEDGTLNAAEQKLYDDYIVQACAYYTWFSAAPFIAFKTTRGGIVKQTTQNSDTVEMDEFAYYTKRVENMAIFYANRLRNYLDENAELFPLYRTESCGKSKPVRGGQIYLNFK